MGPGPGLSVAGAVLAAQVQGSGQGPGMFWGHDCPPDSVRRHTARRHTAVRRHIHSQGPRRLHGHLDLIAAWPSHGPVHAWRSCQNRQCDFQTWSVAKGSNARQSALSPRIKWRWPNPGIKWPAVGASAVIRSPLHPALLQLPRTASFSRIWRGPRPTTFGVIRVPIAWAGASRYVRRELGPACPPRIALRRR